MGYCSGKCRCVGILRGGKWEHLIDNSRRVYDPEYICPTLNANGGGNQEVKIIESGADGIYTGVSTDYQRGPLKDISRCLKAEMHDAGVVLYDGEPKVKKIGNCNPSGNGMNGNVYDSEFISPTLTTNKGEGLKIYAVEEPQIIDPQGRKNKECKPSDDCPTLRAQMHGNPPQVIEPVIGAIRGRNPDNPADRTAGVQTIQLIGQPESRQSSVWRLVAA